MSGACPQRRCSRPGHAAQAIRDADCFGVGSSEPTIDFGRVRDHVRGVIAAIAPNDSVDRFTAMGVRVVQAPARFAGPRTLLAGDVTIEARRFVLATGSRPSAPPITGLDGVPFLTNETVFDLGERPQRLIVIGGGPIGVELAQAFRRLGAAVVILEAARLLPREDPEMAGVVERALLAEGVELRVGATIERVEGTVGRIRASFTREGVRETVEGSHVLVAAGRRPVTEDLGLESAGVAFDLAGITVDRGLRTTNRHIYAIGDCAGPEAGPLKFTHVANYHAGLVIRSALFRMPVKVDTAAIPRVTYTDPEIASVGMTEEEARAAHPKIRILRWPVAENDRAQAERRTQGHAKAIVTPRGKILGCSIAAPGAGDLIVPWSLAIAKGMKASDLAGLVFPYPTLSEVSKRASVEFLRPQTRNVWARRFIAAARRLG
jgi:pyruvate/2-oxoglutarate dehydrogenase complex dihydrolipoamide dehydrogenase (E3) component